MFLSSAIALVIGRRTSLGRAASMNKLARLFPLLHRAAAGSGSVAQPQVGASSVGRTGGCRLA